MTTYANPNADILGAVFAAPLAVVEEMTKPSFWIGCGVLVMIAIGLLLGAGYFIGSMLFG